MQSQPSFSKQACRLLRVVIVDDMPQVRQDLRLLLELSGVIEVVGEASNGLEAISQTESLRPDVVLLDLEMPVMDGFEAAKQIKARMPACRLVAFSIHSYPQARQKAVQAGMDGFLEKGAPLDSILQALLSAHVL